MTNYISYNFSSILLICFSGFLNWPSGLIAQNEVGIITTEFKFHDAPYPDGKRLQSSLDFAISKNKTLKIVDREKLGSMRDQIQTEKNLEKDYSSSFNDSLRVLGASYIAYGDVAYSYGSEHYRIIISFLKISGNDISERLPITLKVHHSDIQNYSMIDTLFMEEIRTFTETYFTKGKYDFSSIPSIIKRVENQDSVISTLEIEIDDANSKIKTLEEHINSITALSIDIQIAFDSINVIKKGNRKVKGSAVALLSPSLDKAYQLKTGESFITFRNEENGIIQNSNSKAIWYRTRLSLIEKNLIDMSFERLIKYKGLVVQVQNIRLPDKTGTARMNIAMNGKTAISNTVVPYKLYYSKDGSQQFMFDLEKVIEIICTNE